MTFALQPHQVDAIAKLDTGKVLVGDVGTGKSIAALAYSATRFPDKKIIVITTAKKRDSGEWYADALKMSLRPELHVDSWNNIKNYVGEAGVSFVFDEQRVVGNGAWVDAFLKICKHNDWILLSATPADTWMDLVPVFLANGFYRNKTEFNNLHVRWSRFAKYPKVDGYIDPWVLENHRKHIYVEMPFMRTTTRIEHIVDVEYDRAEELLLYKDRWNFYENAPLKDAGEMMRLMRVSCNSHWSRFNEAARICTENDRVIIFYNHNYELEILRALHVELDIPMSEWNGQNHQDIPQTDRWIYLVQYQAGAEGWNCIETDTVLFYSLPYSYRNFEQAKGRIDRLNTKFETLHYHIFKSRSIIDQAIWKALRRKKNFHASAFAKKTWAPKEQFTRMN